MEIQDLLNILNNLDDMIYITDLETDKILFANSAIKRVFNMDDIEGKICYEFIYNETKPCKLCSNKNLQYDKYYEWEIKGKITKKDLLIKVKLIKFNGKIAKLVVLFDMTNFKDEYKIISDKLEYEIFYKDILGILWEKDKDLKYILNLTEQFLNSKIHIIKIDDIENDFMLKLDSQVKDISNLTNNHENIEVSELNKKLILSTVDKFKKDKSFVIDDIKILKDKDLKYYEILKSNNIKNLIFIPVYIQDKLIYCIETYNVLDINKSKEALDTVAKFLSIALEKNLYEEELKLYAELDKLTNLGNRNKYIKVENNIKNSKKIGNLGIIFIDINGLKYANDKFGHKYGDSLIVETANILKGIWSEYSIFRVGGDEFLIIAEDICEDYFYKLVKETLNIFNNQKSISISMGYDWSNNSIDISNMISNADTKMYISKKNYYKDHPIHPRNRSHIDKN